VPVLLARSTALLIGVLAAAVRWLRPEGACLPVATTRPAGAKSRRAPVTQGSDSARAAAPQVPQPTLAAPRSSRRWFYLLLRSLSSYLSSSRAGLPLSPGHVFSTFLSACAPSAARPGWGRLARAAPTRARTDARGHPIDAPSNAAGAPPSAQIPDPERRAPKVGLGLAFRIRRPRPAGPGASGSPQALLPDHTARGGPRGPRPAICPHPSLAGSFSVARPPLPGPASEAPN